jgi:hypothetical protein
VADITTLSSANAHVATEVLSRQVLDAERPRLMVLQSLAHMSTATDGAFSSTRKITKLLDHGAASAGTEATDPTPTPTVELDYDTPISGSVTMGVHEIATISEEKIKKELGLSDAQVRGYFNGARQFNVEQLLGLLSLYVQQLIPMGLRKIEADGLALFSSISGSVGQTDAYYSIAQVIQTIFAYRRQNPMPPNQRARFLLGNNMLERLTAEALTTNGGLGGSLWNMQAEFSALNMPPGEFEQNGYVGGILRYPVHEISEDLVPTSGGADIGIFGVPGVPGVPADSPSLGGKCGAFELTVDTPLQVRVDFDTSNATIELTLIGRYLWLEVADASAIRCRGQS